MLQRRPSTALDDLGLFVAVRLREGEPAELLAEGGAAATAVRTVLSLDHAAATAAIPESAFDEDGLAADARPLLAGLPAPLCAARRAGEDLVVLMAWGVAARRAPVGSAFEALGVGPPPLPFEDVFENAALGMVVVGGDRRVHSVNRAGRTLLAEGSTLVVEGGRLRARHDGGDRRLGEALSQDAACTGPRTLLLAPFSGGIGLRCEVGRIDRPLARSDEAARFLVTAAPAPADAPVEGLLAQRFGLTRAEARLAGHLAAGRDLRAAGELMGVSRHTARKYLQIAFSKMGVRRQADLVRRALQISHEAAD